VLILNLFLKNLILKQFIPLFNENNFELSFYYKFFGKIQKFYQLFFIFQRKNFKKSFQKIIDNFKTS
jgi:hypothetical protein